MSKQWKVLPPVDEADVRYRSGAQSPWRELHKEVRLRLEQTPSRVWLPYEFADATEADRARESVRRYFNVTFGFGTIDTRKNTSTPEMIYFRRGKNYSANTKNRRLGGNEED